MTMRIIGFAFESLLIVFGCIGLLVVLFLALVYGLLRQDPFEGE